MYELRLYIVGQTPKTMKAIHDLKSSLENGFRNRYSLEIIDLFQNPKAAHRDNIIATPTLIKAFPPPAKRVIGDFTDMEKVLPALGLI